MSLALIPLMLGLGFLCLALAPLFDTKLLIFDLLSHFPLQAALGAAGVFVLCLPWRRKTTVNWGLLVLLCAVLGNGAWLYPYWNNIAKADDPGRPDLTIAQLNVQRSNRDFEATIGWLRRVKPDVFVVEEVDSGWFKALSTLSARFPYQVSEPQSGNFGLAVFSRFPIVRSRKTGLPLVPVPAIFLRLDVAGRAVRLAAIHTVPPESQALVTARNLSLEVIGQWVAEEPGTPTFVVGDLNITPFAAPFRAFTDYSGLGDARAGQGLLVTWPTYVPSFARIPIDYILHNRHLRTLTLKTGGHNGSDHAPILGEFMFAK
jgi:endonuclease/exonuclease/phosphatase (EEP) superfamily protein YafD